MSASAEPVYKFIDECLKVIKNDSPPPEFTQIPDLADIKTIEPAASLPASFANVKISDIETIKTALEELLPVIGYENKNPIFLKKFDSKMPAKPVSGYWAININTGNVWAIDKYTQANPAEPLYGGKKRKTNRRKHRRSNRKTLGRKK